MDVVTILGLASTGAAYLVDCSGCGQKAAELGVKCGRCGETEQMVKYVLKLRVCTPNQLFTAIAYDAVAALFVGIQAKEFARLKHADAIATLENHLMNLVCKMTLKQKQKSRTNSAFDPDKTVCPSLF
ncbi:MAG: hypothetical protein SGCHY_005543 [Lobulomycetales sp.]